MKKCSLVMFAIAASLMMLGCASNPPVSGRVIVIDVAIQNGGQREITDAKLVFGEKIVRAGYLSPGKTATFHYVSLDVKEVGYVEYFKGKDWRTKVRVPIPEEHGIGGDRGKVLIIIDSNADTVEIR